MRVFLVLATAALLLAGCASPSPEPTSAVPEPPSPSATPEAVAAPGPRVPLDCAGATEGARLSDLLGGEPVPDTTGGPSTFTAALDQTGVLRCVWTSGETASFHLLLTPLDAYDDGGSAAPTVSCDVSAGHHCRSTASIASFRLETALTGPGAGTTASVTAQFQSTLDAIARNVDGAGTLPVWTSPERATTPYGDCSALSSPEITATLHPNGAPATGDSGDGFDGVYRAFEHSGWNSCTFEIPDPVHPLPVVGTFTVEYIPGGGWAWPVTGDPIEVAGADEAVSRCFDAGYCQVDARVGDSWVSGGFGNAEYDIQTAARYLAAVIPSLPIVAA